MPAPDASAIAGALERLVTSPQFAGAPRASRFLRFVVEAALRGSGEGLKEYVLGVEVFDRAASFDPRIDTIVRVEAVKLRKRIEEYYRGPGSRDPVLIELPKGCYVPRFRLRDLREEEAHSDNETKSIAVLPFANLSADPENQYFGDGVAEEILNGLARVPGLRVVARTSAFAFRGKEQDIRGIAQTLNVGAILEGSVRRAGDRIRIAVQLINASDGCHLWSDGYDRQITDVFAIQEEIAQAVVSALRIKLILRPVGALVRRGTHNLEAYNAYLEGRYHQHRLTAASMDRCRACHERAIALDPNFAAAHAGMAEYYYFLAFFLNARPREVLPLALAAARRALELDPECAEAHSIRGSLRAAYEYNRSQALDDFDRALALNPGLASALHRRGSWCYRPLGRLEEAAEDIRKGIELDPLSAWPRSSEPYVLHLLGRKAEAVQRAREVLELFPWYWYGYFFGAVVLLGGGLVGEATAAVEKGLTIDPSNACLLAVRAAIHASAGETEDARRILQRLEEAARTQYLSPAALAIASRACGDVEATYEWLHKGIDERDVMTAGFVGGRPPFPGHQNDPRYHALLRKMNLEDLLATGEKAG